VKDVKAPDATAATTASEKNVVAAALSKETSAWQMAKTVYRHEGPLAFWRGNLPSCLRVSGTAAINFTCMEYYKRVAVAPFVQQRVLLRRSQTSPEALRRRQHLATSFVSGGLAGATSTTLLYPFEFLRTRLALDVGAAGTRFFSGMSDVSAKIYRTDGVTGFFQGYGIALAGGIFYRVLFLGGYDVLKSEVLLRKTNNARAAARTNFSVSSNCNNSDNEDDADNNSKLSWGERILCAQTISLTAGTLSYPFDSIRRRMMMQAGVPRNERRYRSSIDCVAQVFRAEGVRGFYLGLAPNIVRSVGGALLLVFYDTFRTYLR